MRLPSISSPVIRTGSVYDRHPVRPDGVIIDGSRMSWLEEKDNDMILSIRVVPRAAKDGIQGILGDEALKVRIQAPPVEGKANVYLVKFLSKLWKIPRSRIEILSGETGRNKRLRITNPPDALRKELQSLGNN